MDFWTYNLHKIKGKQKNIGEYATECVWKVQMGGRRETYPSGEYYEMDVLSLMQNEHRNHGFSVVATNNLKHTCLLWIPGNSYIIAL